MRRARAPRVRQFWRACGASVRAAFRRAEATERKLDNIVAQHFRNVRDDAVKRAIRRFSAAKYAAHARAVRAPCNGARVVRLCV
eukprot:7011412-Lingulodinium_polyedra.AAC.1